MQSTAYKHIGDLERFLEDQGTNLVTNVWVKTGEFFQECEISLARKSDASGAQLQIVHVYLRPSPGSYDGQHDRASDLPSGFSRMLEWVAGSEPIMDTLVVKTDGLVSPADPLYALTRAAWCELFKIDSAFSAQKVPDATKFRKELVRKQFLSWLTQSAPNIEYWNSRSERLLASFKGSDLHCCQLPGINFKQLDFRQTNFNQSCFEGAFFGGSDLMKSTFVEADLRQCNLYNVKAANSDFSRANMQKAHLTDAKLQNANLTGADLTGARVWGADLRGANLTDCIVAGADFNAAKYDENTKLPKEFPQWAQLKWKGSGADPYKESQKQSAFATAPVDFPGFIEHLRSNFDRSRLDKALSMLKAESFQLYCRVNDECVTGVVKSQTDAELLYSCRLSSSGTFACCTQNLNACGGLRGALCKHILVLVIGLTKAGQLLPTTAAHWVLASKVEAPLLDKDVMADSFIQYKGVEAGDIDWRPTETVPEDYYAF